MGILSRFSGAGSSAVSRCSQRAGAADFSSEARDAIDAAFIFTREPNDDGPRVAVLSDALRGSFIFTREEAQRRIGVAFPELSTAGVRRAVRHLESRVDLACRPFAPTRRPDWIHGWRERDL